MHAQRSENLASYLRGFLRALNRRAATEGPETFAVQVLDNGLTEADVELLR